MLAFGYLSYWMFSGEESQGGCFPRFRLASNVRNDTKYRIRPDLVYSQTDLRDINNGWMVSVSGWLVDRSRRI